MKLIVLGKDAVLIFAVKSQAAAWPVISNTSVGLHAWAKKEAHGYIDKSEMDASTIIQDCIFLEDVRRHGIITTYAEKNETRNLLTAQTINGNTFVKLAMERGVDVQLAPVGLTKNSQNTTSIDEENGLINWRIEFKLPLIGLTLVTDCISEETTLKIVFLKKFHSNLVLPLDRDRLLSYYGSDGEKAGPLKFFMLAECRPKRDDRYFDCDPNLSITELLFGKTVLEYPTFIVVEEAKAKDYNLMPTDGS